MSYFKRYVRKHLGDQADPELTRKITRAVINRPLAKIALPFVATLALVLMVVLLIPLFEYAEETLGVPALLIQAFISLLMVVGVSLVLWGVVRRSHNARNVLHQELLAAEIRPVVCLFCGYSLINSVSDSCPECGAELTKVEDQRS